MAVKSINEEKCIGCRTCVMSCSMDVFRFDSERRKAVVRYPQDCVLCRVCLADCPADAIIADKTGTWVPSGY